MVFPSTKNLKATTERDQIYVELNVILQSFLQSKGDGTPPTISKYDIPHIVDVIGRRIIREMARAEPQSREIQ